MKKYCLVIPDNIDIEEYNTGFKANAGINKEGYAELFIKLDKKTDIYGKESVTALPVPIICEYDTVKLSNNASKLIYSADREIYNEYECFTDIITRRRYWKSKKNMRIPETIISFHIVKEITAKEVLDILKSLTKDDIRRYKWQMDSLETYTKEADKEFLDRLNSAKTSEELSEYSITNTISNIVQNSIEKQIEVQEKQNKTR